MYGRWSTVLFWQVNHVRMLKRCIILTSNHVRDGWSAVLFWPSKPCNGTVKRCIILTSNHVRDGEGAVLFWQVTMYGTLKHCIILTSNHVRDAEALYYSDK